METKKVHCWKDWKPLRMGNKTAAVYCILNFHMTGTYCTCCDKSYRIWNISSGHLDTKNEIDGCNNYFWNDSYIPSEKLKDIK